MKNTNKDLEMPLNDLKDGDLKRVHDGFVDNDDDSQNQVPLQKTPSQPKIMMANRKRATVGNEAEIYRLAGRPPLKTILSLMIGPILTNVTGALYGVISTVWISHAVGEVGMSAVATEYCFECIGRAFGSFLQCSGSTQISYLFGQKLEQDAPQVICDILRFCFLCAAIVPAILIPIHDPVAKWYGASPETIKEGYDYLLPLILGALFTCINLSCEGFLQAEGRTMLIGIINIASLGGSMAALVPLFLYGFKMGIRGCSIATVLADAIPGIILVICYFSGVFGVKPKLNMLLKPFSKHTWKALGVGASQLISNLAMNIPGVFVRKLIGMSTTTHDYDNAMAGFNVFCRYAQVINCVVIAVTTGYIPAASFSFAAKDYMRYLWLSLHTGWIAFAWSTVTTLFSLTMPRQISQLFNSGEEFLNFAGPMLRISNALGFIMFMRFNAQAMLQALQNGTRAMIISFMSNFVATIGFAYVLFYTNKHNVVRLMWVYPLTYSFGFVFGIIMLIGPMRNIYKLAKGQEIGEAGGVSGGQKIGKLEHSAGMEDEDIHTSSDDAARDEGTDIAEL